MSYQLKPDEVLETLQTLDPELAEPFEALLCQTVNAMGAHISRLCGVDVGEATMQGVAFAGICLPVRPAYRGQPVHPAFEHYDTPSEWEEDAKDEDLPSAPANPDPLPLYRKLHDGLSDMIEGNRLTEVDVPDDYRWLVESLATLAGVDPS